MNKTALAKKIRQLTAKPNPEDFIFDLLLAYKLPRSSVTILKGGPRNMLAAGGGVTMKRKLFFLPLRPEDDPLTVRDEIRETLTENQRFIVLTDYVRFYGYDTKLDEALDCDLTDLADHYDFFLPWAGIEKTRHYDENPADVKAAGRMAKLFDVIKQENPDDSPAFVHDLNVFLSRVLFCFFAEDTGIFDGNNLFSNGIGSQTELDGSDLQAYLSELFVVLDTPKAEWGKFREHFHDFEYVNGGLFRDRIRVPTFSARSRRALIDAGTLDWADINPDIFGSMIQAVVDTEKRGGLGMHYTSVPNIMKVIEPLFLNDLREAFTKAHGGRYEKNDLRELRERIGKLKIFDPACGSGNFLIIAYKELRKLEMEIIQRQAVLGADAGAGESLFEQGAGAVSTLSLNQFYGIEIDDFAHEIAILALWLAEHQMNADFERVFGQSKPTLPLADAGHIVHANACRVDWEEVCPKEEGDETYILGNPPYLGKKAQSKQQKDDLKSIFGKQAKSVDFISAWFLKGRLYIEETSSQFAFVTTISICQGEQVSLIWPEILTDQIKIRFAYSGFLWDNNAKGNASVTVTIIGVDNNPEKTEIFSSNSIQIVNNISPYLVGGKTIYVYSRNKPLSDFPEMTVGNMPADGGKLLLTPEEKNVLISKNKLNKKFIKEIRSNREYLHGQFRYCIWLKDQDASDFMSSSEIAIRVNSLKGIREESSRPFLADIPHLFAQIPQPIGEDYILVPRHSSENRSYIPMSYFTDGSIVHDSCLLIPSPKLFHFGLFMSLIHMAWVKAVCGRIKSDFRYSKDIVYNTFPFPPITPAQEQELTETALGILAAREQHPGSTLAELYDPDKMPENLRAAHRANDLAVERCYRPEPFGSDEERLAYLFKLYEEMVAAEQERDTLFAAGKKKKKNLRNGKK